MQISAFVECKIAASSPKFLSMQPLATSPGSSSPRSLLNQILWPGVNPSRGDTLEIHRLQTYIEPNCSSLIF